MDILKTNEDEKINVGRTGSVTGVVEFDENLETTILTNAEGHHVPYGEGVGLDNAVFDFAFEEELTVDIDNTIVSYKK